MSTNGKKPITRSMLVHSLQAAYRIEDTLWSRLTKLGITERSDVADVERAMPQVTGECPDWCEREAFNTVAEYMTRWTRTFGTPHKFWEIRRKQDAA